MQRLGIGFGIQFHQRALCSDSSVIGLERQYAIARRFFFSIAPERLITRRSLPQRERVTRVELDRALKVSDCLFPAALTPLDQTALKKYPPIIGQGLASKFQFGQSAVIIAVSLIKILPACQVRFTGIWTESRRCLNGRISQRQARGCMIVA